MDDFSTGLTLHHKYVTQSEREPTERIYVFLKVEKNDLIVLERRAVCGEMLVSPHFS